MITSREDLKRQQILAEKGAVSTATYEKSKSKYEEAVSKEKITTSRLEKATRDLERTKLTAPFDGTITSRIIEPHQETQTGRVVFKIQSAEGLKVELLVPESLIRSIKPKQLVKIEFPTLKGTVISGTVREIGTQSNAGNSFTVTIDLSQTTPDLRTGMSTLVTFGQDSDPSAPLFLIPLSAIDTRPKPETLDKKQVTVFVYDKTDSKVKQRTVTIQDIQGNQIEVINGLKEGDVLVSAGVPFLENDQQVIQWQQKYRSPETDR